MFNTDECDSYQRTGLGTRVPARVLPPGVPSWGTWRTSSAGFCGARGCSPSPPTWALWSSHDFWFAPHTLHKMSHSQKWLQQRARWTRREDKTTDWVNVWLRDSSEMRCRRKGRFWERDSPELTSWAMMFPLETLVILCGKNKQTNQITNQACKLLICVRVKSNKTTLKSAHGPKWSRLHPSF